MLKDQTVSYLGYRMIQSVHIILPKGQHSHFQSSKLSLARRETEALVLADPSAKEKMYKVNTISSESTCLRLTH